MRRISARYPRAMFAAAIVCVLLILPASSCSTNQIMGNTGLPRIQFAGDSITVQSTAEINAHYGGSYDVGIWGIVGATTWIAAGHVADEALDAPEVEVINLGTNDAKQMPIGPGYLEPPGTIDDTLARLTAMNAEFPTSTCVVFVTVKEESAEWGPPENAIAINALLRTFPHVADWAAELVPEDFTGIDNPHPNAVGRQHLLQVEDAAIAGCPT